MPETDFDGCAHECRRPLRKHTYRWGYREHAPESSRPELRVTMGGVRTTADDDYPSIVLSSYTISELAGHIEAVLRTVPVDSGEEYSAMALAVATAFTTEGFPGGADA